MEMCLFSSSVKDQRNEFTRNTLREYRDIYTLRWQWSWHAYVFVYVKRWTKMGTVLPSGNVVSRWHKSVYALSRDVVSTPTSIHYDKRATCVTFYDCIPISLATGFSVVLQCVALNRGYKYFLCVFEWPDTVDMYTSENLNFVRTRDETNMLRQ